MGRSKEEVAAILWWIVNGVFGASILAGYCDRTDSNMGFSP